MEKTEKGSARNKNKALSKGANISMVMTMQNISALVSGCLFIVFLRVQGVSLSSFTIMATDFRMMHSLTRAVILGFFMSSLITFCVLVLVRLAVNKGVLGGSLFVAPKPIENANPFKFAKYSNHLLKLATVLLFFGALYVNKDVFTSIVESFLQRSSHNSHQWAAILIRTLVRFFSIMIVVVLVSMCADITLSRVLFERNTKMSKYEVKKEHEDNEGKPEVKKAINASRNESLTDRELAGLNEADVIVVNPTKIVCGVAYNPKRFPVPYITFIAVGHKAGYARSKLRQCGRRTFEDFPLARRLSTMEVGEPIPSETYRNFIEHLRKL